MLTKYARQDYMEQFAAPSFDDIHQAVQDLFIPTCAPGFTAELKKHLIIITGAYRLSVRKKKEALKNINDAVLRYLAAV